MDPLTWGQIVSGTQQVVVGINPNIKLQFALCVLQQNKARSVLGETTLDKYKDKKEKSLMSGMVIFSKWVD